MEILDLLKRIKESKEYKDWKKEHKDSILAHVFKLLDDANMDDWQVGFYNKDDTITTFLITGKEIKIAPAENIFKKPDAKVLALEESKIKIDITEALQTAEKLQTTEYSKETPFKIITILQKIEQNQA